MMFPSEPPVIRVFLGEVGHLVGMVLDLWYLFSGSPLIRPLTLADQIVVWRLG
jgi:hypothetical protein